jgi:hypothetical protein
VAVAERLLLGEGLLLLLRVGWPCCGGEALFAHGRGNAPGRRGGTAIRRGGHGEAGVGRARDGRCGRGRRMCLSGEEEGASIKRGDNAKWEK